MQRPTTPSINIDNTTQDDPQEDARSPPRSNPRPRSTASSEQADDDPWRRPSIRIRRLPSNQTVTRARAASVATGSRPRAGSNAEYRGVRYLSVAAGSAAAPPTPGSDGLLTVEAPSSSTTRARSGSGSGSGSNRYLRHENRRLEAPEDGGRRRSSSDPPHMQWQTLPGATPGGRGAGRRGSAYMPPLEEGTATSNLPQRPPNLVLPPENLGVVDQNPEDPGYFGIGRRLSNAAGQTYSRFFPALNTVNSAPPDPQEEQFELDMVDVLDTIDPEISTLNTLNNVQNSLFVPDLGRYLNRRPTYTLTRRGTGATPAPTIKEEPVIEEAAEVVAEELEAQRIYTVTSMTSRLDDDHFAVLPHGERLQGWTAEDRAELDDHVRHLLHSRKEKFKRSMRGFGQYVKKPLGFFVTLYATLITLFGLAWVLFLIGWINLGGRKDYIINVIDNVLVALFAIIGDGLAPFRAVDTYHMCFIAHYHHLTWRLRREQSLPKLQNRNDLPGLGPSWDKPADTDAEAAEHKQTEYSVLSPKQQKRLVHHQKKFSRSHTFYKPHETATHFAFPLRLLVAVVVLLDCHSLLQISLGTCTWAISYHVRPFALTTVILCCSITCNITAGILISVGDHKTRKKDVLERMFRQELTTQAMHKVEERKQKEKERNQSLEVPRTNLSTAGPMHEKEEEAGSTSEGVDGGAIERWESAREEQSHPQTQETRPQNPSTTTTTTTTGPTTITTTTTTGW